MSSRLNSSNLAPLNSRVAATTAVPKPAATPAAPQTTVEFQEQPFIFVCSHQDLYLDKKRRPLSEEVILKKINDAFKCADQPWIRAIQFGKARRVRPPTEKTFDPPRRLRLDVKTWRDRAGLYAKGASQRDWLRLLEQHQPYGAILESTELRPRPFRARKTGMRGGQKGGQKPEQKGELNGDPNAQLKTQQSPELKAQQKPQPKTEPRKSEPKAQQK